MPDDDDFCIAHFVPVNTRARSLLSKAIHELAKEGKTDQLRFYADEKIHLSTGSSGDLEEPFDAETAFAKLSIAQEKLPRFPRLGWRVGKGAKNADIRIAPASDESLTLANQFLLFIHPRSGQLVLKAGEEAEFTPLYKSTSSKFIELKPLEELVLLQQSTQIQVAECRFQVEYTLSSSRPNKFFSHLTNFINEHHKKLLHPEGRLNPSIGFSAFYERYVVGGKMGAGTYADVRYGIDVKTGEPVALKDIRVRNSHSRHEILNEIAILERFRDSPYINRLIECWCEHNVHPKDCPGNVIEHYYLVMDLAIHDFSSLTTEGPLSIRDILDLFRQILIGIQTLHCQGVMHRDISLKNMLVTSFEPPRAALGDFGKAITSLYSTETAIGPIPYCAPEVWTGTYNEAIDVWSWAYAIAQYLGYTLPQKEQNSRITPQRLGSIHLFLDGIAWKGPVLKKLVDLLSRVLLWNPQSRYSLEQMLAHDVWHVLDNKELQELPQPKKAKLENLGKQQGSEISKQSGETLSTVAISEDTE